MAQPTKGGHDLVRDIQHVVLLADFPGPAVITRRRHDDPACAQNRLSKEGSDVLGPESEDLLLELIDELIAELLYRQPGRPAIDLGAGHVMDEVTQVMEVRRAIAFTPRERHRKIGAAVIRADA